MKTNFSHNTYFPFEIQISGTMWKKLDLSNLVADLANRPAPPAILY